MRTILLICLLTSWSTALFSEEVAISIRGKVLQGELQKPAEKKASRVVFILAGSGPTDRDGNTMGAPGKNNCLKYLAEALQKEGLATLRVDKRGVGASADAGLKESDLRFSTYVEDAKGWIKYLEAQGYADIVLLGHSEGALVATLAASKESVKGVICVAGAGRPASTLLREQLKTNLPGNLYTQADEIITKLTEGKVSAEVPPELNALFRPSVQPYFISWFKFDPAKALSEVKVPVMIIQGSTDLQVSMNDAKLLHAACKGSKLIQIEGMNHVLKEVKGDMRAQLPSYLNPQLPLHKDLVKALVDFVKAD